MATTTQDETGAMDGLAQTPDSERAYLIEPPEQKIHGVVLTILAVVILLGFLCLISSVQLQPVAVADANCISYTQLGFLCAAAGAAGAMIHTMTSFGQFAGAGTLSRRWLWYLYLRIPIGMLLAVLIFLARAADTIGELEMNSPSSIFLTVFSAGLAGLFCKQVTTKLSDLLNFVFGLRPAEKISASPSAGNALAATQLGQTGYVENPVAASLPIAGPDKTIQLVQECLIALGYLHPLLPDGNRLDDGQLGPITRAAVEAYLAAEGIEGAQREATLGTELDPSFWEHLLTLLQDEVRSRPQ